MTYYYLLLSQKEFLENQGLEEILRERSTYFFQQKKPRNFWLVLSPSFVSHPSFFSQFETSQFFSQKTNLALPKETKKTKNHFLVALISLDKDFINWVSLRLGSFENLESPRKKESLFFISTGIKGKNEAKLQSANLLKGEKNQVDLSLFAEKKTVYFDFFQSLFSKTC